MYYTVYKTINLLNGKFYIGKHQTSNIDDGYLGSGISIVNAIKKYGKENFIKDIIYIFDNKWQMELTEKILVVPDREVNYNLAPGGKGGSTNHTDEARQKIRRANLGKKSSKVKIEKIRQKALGRKHTKETKEKLSLLFKGKKGFKHSQEVIDKMKLRIPWNKGKPITSQETLKRISRNSKEMWDKRRLVKELA